MLLGYSFELRPNSRVPATAVSGLFWVANEGKKKTNLRDFAPAKANNLVANERLISNDFLSYASFNKETLIHCC